MIKAGALTERSKKKKKKEKKKRSHTVKNKKRKFHTGSRGAQIERGEQ